ncbi:MAG: pseudouridine synthase [Thermodesulfobacteriota bacterium]
MSEKTIRLQKFLAKAGICSRREGENYIAAGRVQVNGETVTMPGTKVDPENDRVMVDGRPVALEEKPVYILLNKPKGYISSCRQKGAAIVLDLVDVEERVFPVGRLDKDSTGLLLLTNDGRIHHRLAHPSFDHEKEYVVEVKRDISDDALARMAKGIAVDGKMTRPATVKRKSGKSFGIILYEGKKRQIRRMVEAVENEVKTLHRVRMAGLTLGDLPEGKWRYLGKNEINALMALIRE